MKQGEDSMVSWFEGQRKLPGDQFPIGIGDDMAQIRLTGAESCLITTDMLLEGVHFDLTDTSLQQVGYKAMAVSLSDCAAMATMPVAAVVSVALSSDQGHDTLKKLHAGITSAGDKYGCALVGGDMTAWRHALGGLALNVTMMSKPGATPPITRSNAQVGDRICVTGSLGGSLNGKHLSFTPRVQEALHMAKTAGIHAMIDISDGLSTDLNRICQRSAVGALIEDKSIPLSKAAQQSARPVESALHDGEDFELLFTLTQEELDRLLQNWPFAVPITPIGCITHGGNTLIRQKDGRVLDLEARGYDHLAHEDPR
jgi:thiamine-monophosphate kinase